jgi:putative MATE family efflux protein
MTALAAGTAALPASTGAPPPQTPPAPLSPAAARRRLLLEGPIARTLLRLSAPNLVVNVVLITVSTSIDAHFVGRLGPEALAGLALVFPLMMLMQQMANFSMGGAIAAAVARAIGAGRREDAASLALHGVLIATVVAAAITAALLVGGPALYRGMGGQGAILAAAIEYSNAIFAGAIAYGVLGALTSVIRGTGQVAVLAVVYVAAEILHIVLVPLLMFGFGPVPALGITGAGVATVLSLTASSAVLAGYLLAGRTALRWPVGGVRFERQPFREILRTGAPLSLQPILNNASLALLTFYAGMLGATALAGFGAAVRLEYLMYPLVFGLGATVVSMVGTNFGAGQLARAIRIAWTAAGCALAVTGAVGFVAILAPGIWIGFFTGAPDVASSAAAYLVVAALGYPAIGMNTLTQAFQAVGRTLWPLVAVASRTAVIALGGWIAVTMTGGGVAGLAVVTALGLASAGAINALAFWCSMRREGELPR